MEQSTINENIKTGSENVDNDSYKLRKEQFVFGLEGTNPYELLFICSTTFIGIVCYYTFCGSLMEISQIKQKRSVEVRQIFGEIICFVIPMILCQTIWIYPYGIIYATLELFLSFFIMYDNSKNKISNKNNIITTTTEATVQSTEAIMQQIQRVTCTIYRGCILLLTIISILGIDFHLYPRRFGKTEISGYSLMDLGAASFVIMAAISSSSSRMNRTQSMTTDHAHTIPRRNTFRKQVQKMIPLLVMGTIRLITHKGIDYPEHNSEYGIHWNFFYTLAFIIPTASLFKSYIYRNNKPNWVVPILIFITYQFILSYYNLQDFIVHAPRTCPTTSTTALSFVTFLACDLWYANREGIVGCISYTALYLISDYITFTYFWNSNNMKGMTTAKSSNIRVWETTKPLWFSVLALFAAWQLLVSSSSFQFEVSRRSTNTIFCIWVLFVNMFQFVSIYTIVSMCTKIRAKSPNLTLVSSLQLHAPILLSSMNRNGLYIFIIANLFTGIINLSIDTLSMSNHVAITILLLYVGTVGAVSLLLDHLRLLDFGRTVSKPTEIIKED